MRGSLFVLVYVGVLSTCNGLVFLPSHNVIYRYSALMQTEVPHPAMHVSKFNIEANVHIETQNNISRVTLKELSYIKYAGSGNNQDDARPNEMPAETDTIVLPFYVEHMPTGKLEAIYTDKKDDMWSIDIKKGIASLLQLETSSIDQKKKKPYAFYSEEHNVYGNCRILYNVLPLNDTHTKVSKHHSPSACDGHKWRKCSNIEAGYCEQKTKETFSVSSDRDYIISKIDETNFLIDEIKSRGIATIYPIKGKNNPQILRVEQTLTKINVNKVEKQSFDVDNFAYQFFKVQLLPNTKQSERISDITKGRTKVDIKQIMKRVYDDLKKVVEEMQSGTLSSASNDGTNIQLLDSISQNMRFYDVHCMSHCYELLSNDNTKVGKEMTDIFIEMLPFVGSYASSALILKLVTSQFVSDKKAIKLLQDLQFYIKVYDLDLLNLLSDIKELQEYIDEDVRSTAILSFATLVSKTILQQPEESKRLGLFVDYFIDKLIKAEGYQSQMLYMNALKNVGTKKVAEFLKALIKGESSEVANVDYKLRYLALHATAEEYFKDLNAALLLYWPLLSDTTENLDIRIISLDLLIKISTMENFSKLFWFMQAESNQQLYNYYYTKLQGLSNTKSRCLQTSARNAQRFLVYSKKPNNEKKLSEYTYYDYYDIKSRCGEMLQMSSFGDLSNNLDKTDYREISKETESKVYSDYSALIRTTVSPQYYSNNVNFYKGLDYDYSVSKDQKNTEVIIMRNNKVIYSTYGKKYEDLTSELLHAITDLFKESDDAVNRKNIIMNYYTQNIAEDIYIPTDLGIPAMIYEKSVNHFRADYSSNRTREDFDVKVEIKWNAMDSFGITFYNPFDDVWHGSRRINKMNGILAINLDTNIDSSENYNLMLKSKFNVDKDSKPFGVEVFGVSQVYTLDRKQCNDSESCDNQETSITVSNMHSHSQNKTLWSMACPYTGMTYDLVIFECEANVDIYDILKESKEFFSDTNKNSPKPNYAKYLLGLKILIEHLKNNPNIEKCGWGFYSSPSESKDKEYDLSNFINFLSLPMTFDYLMEYSMKEESKEIYKLILNMSETHFSKTDQSSITLSLSDKSRGDYNICWKTKRQFESNLFASYYECYAGKPTKPSDLECPQDEFKFIVNGTSVKQNIENTLVEDCEGKSRFKCLKDRISLLSYNYNVQFANTTKEDITMLNYALKMFSPDANIKSTSMLNKLSGVGSANIDVKYNTIDDSINFTITDQDNDVTNITMDLNSIEWYPYSQPENYLISKEVSKMPVSCGFDVNNVDDIYAKDFKFTMSTDHWTTYVIGKPWDDNIYKIKAKGLETNEFALKIEVQNSTMMIVPTSTNGVFNISFNGTDPLPRDKGVIHKDFPFIYLIESQIDQNMLISLEGENHLIDYNGTYVNIFFEDDRIGGICRFNS